MHSEQQEQFNARLSQWVSNQGFWFQLRHSVGSSGVGGNITYHLFRLALRLFIFIVIVAIGGFFYLVKRTDGDAFRSDLRQSIREALGSEELALAGVKRTEGRLEIRRFAAEGGPGTFFEDFEVRNMRCQMGLLDGLVGKWNTGTIGINRLEAQIRAGTDNPELSADIGSVIFREYEDVRIDNIDISIANIGWGYSERTRGRIDNAKMQLRRVGRDWRITVRGGQFSQNWLHNLEIREIVAVCTHEGITFEKAELRQPNGGSIDFAGLRVSAGDRPQLHGTLDARNLNLESLLPAAARNYVEGTISSELTVGGSTNTSDGISLDGTVYLDGSDTVTIRDRIHLLRALSVIDLYNTYRRLDFTEGSFRFATDAGRLHVTDINMTADELATMTGSFIARPPTPRELDAMMARDDSSGSTFTYGEDAENEEFLLNVEELERQFTLRQAAKAARQAETADEIDVDSRLFDRIEMNYENRMLAEQQAARLARMLIYEGRVSITLPPNAFERTEALQRNHPVNPETGRIPLQVPLNGPLYELTIKQAEEIYELGRR